MTAPALPVAPTPEAALHAPTGAAARERDAERLAGAAVSLVTETVGPAFATREGAAEAYASRLGEPGFALRPVAPDGRPPAPVRALAEGPQRWPQLPGLTTLWRLQVTYWRPRDGEPAGEPLAPARRARREAAGAGLDTRALNRLAAQPLRALRPQQPLDIGLFEVRAPERPDLILPDE